MRCRVESADLDEAAVRYAQTLVDIAGSPPVLDLVHLGHGSRRTHRVRLDSRDGVPATAPDDADLSGAQPGATQCWLITGEDKAAMLVRLRRGDPAIPAGRVRQARAVVLARSALFTARAAAQASGRLVVDSRAQPAACDGHGRRR